MIFGLGLPGGRDWTLSSVAVTQGRNDWNEVAEKTRNSNK